MSSSNQLGAKRIMLSRSDLCSSLAVGRCLAVKAGATLCPPIDSEDSPRSDLCSALVVGRRERRRAILQSARRKKDQSVEK